MNYLLPFLAVMTGYLTVIFFKPLKEGNTRLFLAFSGAFLLALVVFDLLPEIYLSGVENIGLYVMAGILLQIFLEFFSKGAEHGHVHTEKSGQPFPWVLLVSLGIHAFLEGTAIPAHDTLLAGIVIHHIPIAIILTVFFVRAAYSRSATLLFMLLFALMTPAGSLASETLPFLHDVHIQMTALVIGILLHVSAIILFESNRGHAFNWAKLLVVVLGVVLAYFIS